jgi:hypothetical protein
MNSAGGGFVLHTFMAEKSQVDVSFCTSSLPSSLDFRGQGGNLISASFSRLKNEGGGELFQGKRVHQPEYVDEGDF